MTAFFICRPMAAREWIRLPLRLRFSTLDMTDGSGPAPKRRKGKKVKR